MKTKFDSEETGFCDVVGKLSDIDDFELASEVNTNPSPGRVLDSIGATEDASDVDIS